eukprot:550404-Amphidinium_carterae.1
MTKVRDWETKIPLDIFYWPTGWSRQPGAAQSGDYKHWLLYVVETWMLAAILLEKWDSLAAVAKLSAYELPGQPAPTPKEVPRPLEQAMHTKQAAALSPQETQPGETAAEQAEQVPAASAPGQPAPHAVLQQR